MRSINYSTTFAPEAWEAWKEATHDERQLLIKLATLPPGDYEVHIGRDGRIEIKMSIYPEGST